VSNRPLKVLVVDDEEPQLEELARLVGRNPRVSHVETAATGDEALMKLAQSGYDAIFLDIRMPDFDGLEIARLLMEFPKPPALVFVSALDISAAAAFELHAVDYLMKPVASRRIDEALARVDASAAVSDENLEGMAVTEQGAERDVIAVRDLRSRAIRLVTRASILYFKAHGDHVFVIADSGCYVLRSPLASFEHRFTEDGFLRVHRQYLANLARASELRLFANGTAAIRFENGHEIPVSRRLVPAMRRRLHA